MARVAYAAVAMFCLLGGVKGGAQSFGADDLDKLSDGKWFVKFYAPWCGHCQAMSGAYDELADSATGMGVAKIDLTQHESVSPMYGIEGFPTLMLVNEGRVFEYEGERTAEEMKAFAESGWASSAQSSAIPTASSPLKWEQATSEQKAAWAAQAAGGGSESASEEGGAKDDDTVIVDGEDKVDVEPIKDTDDGGEYDPDFPPLDDEGVEIPRDHKQQHGEDAEAAEASAARQEQDDKEEIMKEMQEEFSDPLAFSEESPPAEEDEAGIAEAVVSYTEENAVKVTTLSGEAPPVMSYVTGPVLRVVFFIPRHCGLTLSREGGTYTLSINPEPSVRRAFRADGSAIEDSQVSFELPIAPFKFVSSEEVFASSRRTPNTIAFEFLSGDDVSNQELVDQASDVAYYKGEMPGELEDEAEEADPLAEEGEGRSEEEMAEEGFEDAAEPPPADAEIEGEAEAQAQDEGDVEATEGQEELGDDNGEVYGEMKDFEAEEHPEEVETEEDAAEVGDDENEVVADTNEGDYQEGEALLSEDQDDQEGGAEGADFSEGEEDMEGPGEPIDDNIEEIPEDGEEEEE